MKRLFAITLLSIHLFNIGGYAVMFQYFIHKSDVQIVKQIFDNKIDEAKLIEIKIPAHFAIAQDWDDYAVVEGQIQLKDVYYNYVKLKMTRDTMYFVCLPNATKTRLVHANIIAAKEVSDAPLTKKGHEPISIKKINMLSEYNCQFFTYQYAAFSTPIKPGSNKFSVTLSNPYIESPGKPPNGVLHNLS